jgi:phage baseplate assembly protein gpV
MKGIKLKALRLGRAGALVGASVAVVGLSLLGGSAAHAAGVGSNPGQLAFSPASGPLTTAPTWGDTAACPTGFNFATLEMVYADSTAAAPDINIIGAQTVSGTVTVTGQALSSGLTMGGLESAGGYVTGQTAEAVILCSSGASGTGTTTLDQSIFITFQATTYSTSATGPAGPANTTTVVSASPSTAQVGSTVTISATVTASGGAATPAGTVQFQSGGTAIGSPVTLNASGMATTTTTFTTAGTDALTAVYTPSDATKWNTSTSAAFTETITASNPNSVSEVISVTVAPSGSFTFSGTANAAVPLTVSGSTGTGTLVPVTVADSRTGLAPNPAVPSLVNGFSGFPGWSVVGQATAFTNPTSNPVGTIPANNLGWAPTTPAAGDFTLGGAVTSGLGSAQTLAAAAAGHGDGTFTLGANLTLAIPSGVPAGAYQSTLTLTANPTANFS